MMEGRNNTNWYVHWCEPLVVALYDRDEQRIRHCLFMAWEALAECEMSAKDAACMTFQLTYFDFQAQLVLKDPDWIEKRIPMLIAQIQRPSDIQDAERLRRRLHLQMLITADRLNMRELKLREFRKLFQLVHESDMNTEIWLYVAGWAFLHDCAEYLEHAYEFVLTKSRGFNDTWTWQRVHLMWKLVKGSATRDDIDWIIKQAMIEQHLNSIIRIIWPRAMQMCLIDAELEEKLAQRQRELRVRAQERVAKLLLPHLVGAGNGQATLSSAG